FLLAFLRKRGSPGRFFPAFVCTYSTLVDTMLAQRCLSSLIIYIHTQMYQVCATLFIISIE
ncbi:hypothetical protein L9F63_008934, partial [Diploptera punctata]